MVMDEVFHSLLLQKTSLVAATVYNFRLTLAVNIFDCWHKSLYRLVQYCED